MSALLRTVQTGVALDQKLPRLLGIFARWRLLAYGYTLSVFYAAFFLCVDRWGFWLVNKNGEVICHDFTYFWVTGWQALHGETPTLYDLAEFKALQASP